MANYEDFTLEQLEAAIQEVNRERAQLKQRALAIHKVLDRKIGEEQAKAKLAGMGDAEKQMIAQALQAEGIGSGEEFGDL